MATQITAKCSFTKQGVQVCYPPQNSPGGSGVTGVGSVNYLTKIITLIGADGSAIVTIGNSSIFEDGVNLNSIRANDSFQQTAFYVTDLSTLKSASIVLESSVTESDVSVALRANGVLTYSGLTLGSQLASLKGGVDIAVSSNNISVNTIAWYQDNGSGSALLRSIADGTAGQVLTTNGAGVYSWSTVSGGGGITSLNGLTGATQTFTNDTNVTIVSGGTAHVVTWAGTLADGRIASAATWNAKESPLTFGNGLTRTVNAVANNLITGLAGGQTIVFGTADTDKGIFKATTGNKTVAETNTFIFQSGNNGARELLRIGDGPTGNTGELGMHAVGQSSTSNYFIRALANTTYFNAGTDLRLQVGATDYVVATSGSGVVSVRKPLSMFTAMKITLAAGTTTVQPLLFQSGTNLTTAVAGSMEYNGTNLFFTRSGTTRESVICANSVNSVSPTAQNRTITVVIDGTTYYITAKTTND